MNRVGRLMTGVDKWENKAHGQNFDRKDLEYTHMWKTMEEIWR
jgi:hypothetical protein